MKLFWICIFILATSSSFLAQSEKLPSSMIQDFEGNKVDASTIHSSESPTLVVFWATWCSPAKRQLSILDERYEDWQNKYGIKTVIISIDDARNKHKVAPYVKSKEWLYEPYLDSNNGLFRALNFTNPPHTLLLNKTGEIVWSKEAFVDGDEDLIEDQIKKLFK